MEKNLKENLNVETLFKTTGLQKLIGRDVCLFCLNYIYYGRLEAVTETDVMLHNPHIVYDTGAYTEKEFKRVESLCTATFFVRTGCIESYGELNKSVK